MGITTAIIIMSIAGIFFALSYTTSPIRHSALKLLFLIIAMVVVLIGMNFAYTNAVDNGASDAVQRVLLNLYRVGLYSFVVFMFYIVIYYILYPAFMHFKQYKA